MSEVVKWGQEKRLQTQVSPVQFDLLKGKFVKSKLTCLRDYRW